MTAAPHAAEPGRDDFGAFMCDLCHALILARDAGGMNPNNGQPFCRRCAAYLGELWENACPVHDPSDTEHYAATCDQCARIWTWVGSQHE